MTQYLIAAALGLGIFFSALQVVENRYESRRLFIELQELHKHKDELDQEWSQLLLEQGTWGAHGRVEEIARSKLNMIMPAPDKVYRVKS